MKKNAARQSQGAISDDLLKQLAYNERMAELGRISAGVVHELNAPLSVITSAAQMILREEGVPEFVREMVARMGSEAQRLTHLTRGLLSFSSHNDTPSEVDINLTVGFVLDFLGFEAAKRGIAIQRQLDFSLPTVRLDNNALKQVLLNLIMNALQAMEQEGGTLQLSTALAGEQRLSIMISDNGPGIPEHLLETIFEPYFTTKREGEGTGLGLFVTRRLVGELGGELEVFSRTREGTTFTVTLPTEG